MDPNDASGPRPEIPSGWYPDPAADGVIRYWDGLCWTEKTVPGGGDGDRVQVDHLDSPDSHERLSRTEYTRVWARVHSRPLAVVGAAVLAGAVTMVATRGEPFDPVKETSDLMQRLNGAADLAREFGEVSLASRVHVLDGKRSQRLRNRRGRLKPAPRTTSSIPVQRTPLVRPDGSVTGTRVA